jgi:hypothetical protein
MACRCRVTTTSTATCKTGCITAGYHIIHSADSVGPCGAVGTFDLSTLPFNTTNLATCNGNALIFKVEDWESQGFETVTISGSTVTFTTSNSAVVGNAYKITFSVRCGSKHLSDLGYVKVVIQDLCLDTVCGSGQVCAKCTGGCVDAEIDVST